MTTINLKKEDYAVLTWAESLPPEIRDTFQSTKLRLENIAWSEIDLDSKEGKERYNYAVLKAILLRIYESLEDRAVPNSVSNTVRRLLSELNATYEFSSPYEAVTHRFANGLTLSESLYECGYYECGPSFRKAAWTHERPLENDPKKNVESVLKMEAAYDIPEIPKRRKDVLRIAGALNRSVEADGSRSLDCHVAATRFLRLASGGGGFDPNERIGSFDESAFYLLSKYAVDPRNFESLSQALKTFRALFSEFDPHSEAFYVINPHVVDRKGVPLRDAMRRQTEYLREAWVDAWHMETPFRRISWFVSELEGEWNMIMEPVLDTPMSRKVREAYSS